MEKILIFICIFVIWFIFRPYIEIHKDKIILFYWKNGSRLFKIFRL